MTTPTQAAIEAARERLARAFEKQAPKDVYYPREFRAGNFDKAYATQALAIALQEMSDAVDGGIYWLERVVGCRDDDGIRAVDTLRAFILPDPVVDPLVDAWREAVNTPTGTPSLDNFRAALWSCGLQIVPVQP